MSVSIFEERFKGGHPNSLGNTIEIVNEVLADKVKLPELMATYKSDDEIVRLRLANAVRRICVENPNWIATYLDDLTGWIAQINQASTQWTLAKLFQMLESQMSPAQKQSALGIMKSNIENHSDWIVLNNTMETLTDWSEGDRPLANWLLPHLNRLADDPRKSVAARANKYIRKLT